jgi:hypothetical protein
MVIYAFPVSGLLIKLARSGSLMICWIRAIQNSSFSILNTIENGNQGNNRTQNRPTSYSNKAANTMKLFGKRKRKEDSNSSSKDDVVMELLKKEPSTWNAKQRRLIKRYQDRNKNNDDESPVHSAVVSESEKQASKEQTNATVALSANVLPVDVVTSTPAESKDQNESSSSSSSDDDDVYLSSTTASKDEQVEKTRDNESEQVAVIQDSKYEQIMVDKEAAHPIEVPATGGLKTVGPELQTLLEKLNSKQRRKLSRSIERGESTEEQVQREANELLLQNESQQGATIVVDANASDGATNPSPASKKRRRNTVNDKQQQITPEERLRRTEQRRLQQEAAERRLKAQQDTTAASVSQHTHPLNSERRRANRRKPKFKKKAAPGNEHHSSGFDIRKATKAATKQTSS